MTTKNKIDCEICNISILDQVSYDNHLLGSKHQLALHTKHVREKKEKCSIYITGFSNATLKEHFVEFFSQYDKIVDFFPEIIERFVIIQFENEDTVEKLLKNTIYLQGRKLSIRRRILKNAIETKKPEQNEKEVFNAKIVESINFNLAFNHQLDEFINAVQLPFPNTMNIYNRLCQDIQRCLNVKFVKCRVWPFGSTVYGLGFKHSDVDVFIEVICQPSVPDASESNLAAAYVKLAKNLLCKYNNVFSHLVAIPKAKTPILKCTHKPTGVSCDINFKNMLGVCNSKLINFMLNLDPRLRPAMIIIKFWSQVQEISGCGRISNYGLTMMFLFYLQQHPNPIVPPIGWLQTAHSIQFHEGWNGGFCVDFRFLPNMKTSNKLTVPELLHGFFQFYSKYDFGFNVICPLMGENIAKSDFMITENLPEKLFHYKNMVRNKSCEPFKYASPLCIQDPFELSHNITGCVSQKLLEEFQKSCQITRDICSECTKNTNNLLKSIFTKQYVSNITGATDDECVFKMSVNNTLNYIHLNNIKLSAEDKSKILRQAWFEKVNQFLISALSKIFLFEITIKKDIQKHKIQKIHGQSDIHNSNVIDSILFHCVGYHNIWDARKSIAKTFYHVESSKNSFLEQEIAISDYIVNELCKGIKISEPIVDFYLEFKSKINPTEAEFLLKNENCRKNCFRHMANFIANKLEFWFEKWIKETGDEKKESKSELNEKNIKTEADNTTRSTNNDEKKESKSELNEKNIKTEADNTTPIGSKKPEPLWNETSKPNYLLHQNSNAMQMSNSFFTEPQHQISPIVDNQNTYYDFPELWGTQETAVNNMFQNGRNNEAQQIQEIPSLNSFHESWTQASFWEPLCAPVGDNRPQQQTTSVPVSVPTQAAAVAAAAAAAAAIAAVPPSIPQTQPTNDFLWNNATPVSSVWSPATSPWIQNEQLIDPTPLPPVRSPPGFNRDEPEMRSTQNFDPFSSFSNIWTYNPHNNQ